MDANQFVESGQTDLSIDSNSAHVAAPLYSLLFPAVNRELNRLVSVTKKARKQNDFFFNGGQLANSERVDNSQLGAAHQVFNLQFHPITLII